MNEMVGQLSVSRETFERLETYADLLTKWTQRINLVSKNTLADLWDRHIVDSAQLFQLAPEGAIKWVDLGSGGGFPGLVVAIIAKELAPDMHVTLVESDQRKCAFLRTVARETKVSCSVKAARIEAVEPQEADVLSARALADLSQLLGFADRHLREGGICLFPKGLTWQKEVDGARESWLFEVEKFMSETDENAVVLKVEEIAHV